MSTNTPSASALVPVFTGTIAGQPTQFCNARDLHAVLESGQEFAAWIKNRIEQYDFAEGEDFLIAVSKTSRHGGRPRTDYHLSIDMAKELAMVENNDRGRQVRRYFIAVEKAARANVGANPISHLENRLKHGRYLLHFDHHGKMQIQEVPETACVMTRAQMLKALADPGGMMVKPAELAEFVIAATRRLQQSCEFHAAKAAGKPVKIL